MKKWYAAPALAGLVLVGSASMAEAAPLDAVPSQTETTDDGDGGNAGLWGLLGLAGLAGLAGLKRRDRDVRSDHASASSIRTP